MTKKLCLAWASLVLLSSCRPSKIEPTSTPTQPAAAFGSVTFPTGRAALRSATALAIPFTITGAQTTSLVDALGTTAAPPSGLSLTATGTAACQTLALVGTSARGGVTFVNGCTGDGTISLRLQAGVAVGQGGQNAASTLTRFYVFNTPPAVASATAPASPTGPTGAGTVTFTFASLVGALSATNSGGEIVVSGCTTTQPTATTAMSTDGAGHSIASVSLSGGACASGNTISVSVNQALVTDVAGNVGAGMSGAVTYVVP